MALPAHTRTWQFKPNIIIADAASAEAGSDSMAIALVNAFLGRGTWVDKDGVTTASSGNWTVTSSCRGNGGSNFGNNDNVNWWDLSGALYDGYIVHAAAASNHSWIVLEQTGIATKYQVCIDFSNATTTSATVVVSFGAGFGLANGGADGTATARPTATDQQILISNTDWGPAGTTPGSVCHCMKSSDGKAFRFIIMRGNYVVGWYQFEIPDPVVSGWTNPSIAHAIATSTSGTEQMSFTRLTGANTYSKTAGGTIFTSSYVHPGMNAGTGGSSLQINYGQPNTIDYPQTRTFHEICLYSTTTNARYLNGKIVDAFWGQENGTTEIGNFSGETAPAGGPAQWGRFGNLWLTWCANNNPRTGL